jgi:hypothetical protein
MASTTIVYEEHSYLVATSPLLGTFRQTIRVGGHALKERLVIPDGHGERQEFFESLPGGPKTEGDAARLNGYSLGEDVQFLIDDGSRRGHHQSVASLLTEGADLLGESSPALMFVVNGIAGGETMEVRNQDVAVRQTVHANLPRDAGRQDLLGPTQSDAEQILEDGTVHPRVGQGMEAAGDFP